MDRFFEWSTKYKNLIFIVLCLIVHITYLLIFALCKCLPLALLNIFSVFFYTNALIHEHVREKDGQSRVILRCYFEILIFCMISEFISGGGFGFIFIILGMIAIIFYMIPESLNINRYLIQVFGVVVFLLVVIFDDCELLLFPNVYASLVPIKHILISLNSTIIAVTTVYVSWMYMMELDRMKKELHYNVGHDVLTGLYNRRYFEEYIRDNIKEYKRNYAIVMFDIDDFKKVNDTYGHETGDKVLQMVSGTLKKNMGENDIAVRWGGEEFIILFSDVDMVFAERKTIQILNDIRRTHIPVSNGSIRVTSTAGIETATDLRQYEAAIRKADKRLYYGKEHGKNCHIKEDPVD